MIFLGSLKITRAHDEHLKGNFLAWLQTNKKEIFFFRNTNLQHKTHKNGQTE